GWTAFSDRRWGGPGSGPEPPDADDEWWSGPMKPVPLAGCNERAAADWVIPSVVEAHGLANGRHEIIRGGFTPPRAGGAPSWSAPGVVSPGGAVRASRGSAGWVCGALAASRPGGSCRAASRGSLRGCAPGHDSAAS